jgi:hypothetical protein
VIDDDDVLRVASDPKLGYNLVAIIALKTTMLDEPAMPPSAPLIQISPPEQASVYKRLMMNKATERTRQAYAADLQRRWDLLIGAANQ